MHSKYCPRCEKALPISAFNRNTARRDGLTVYCTDCYRQYGKILRERRKAAAFEHLGGKCAACGFADWRALQIDHKNGDGAAHRREHGGPAIYYAVLEDDGTLFQLLCANCNWIKKFEDAEIGNRVYSRLPPLEELVIRANRRWTPEQRQRQAEKAKAMWADPEKRAGVVASMTRARRNRVS